jgi:hypothetical protein
VIHKPLVPVYIPSKTGGDVVLVNVIPTTSPQAADTTIIVYHLRNNVTPAAVGKERGEDPRRWGHGHLRGLRPRAFGQAPTLHRARRGAVVRFFVDRVSELVIPLVSAINAAFITTAVVPSLMMMLGKADWWFPQALHRLLPKVSVEADDVAARPVVPVPDPELV